MQNRKTVALLAPSVPDVYTALNGPAATVALKQRPRCLDQRESVVFPEEAQVLESQLHMVLRSLLYDLLFEYLGENATVGSEQFIYYAADPAQSLAPDVYVRLQPRGEMRR